MEILNTVLIIVLGGGIWWMGEIINKDINHLGRKLYEIAETLEQMKNEKGGL